MDTLAARLQESMRSHGIKSQSQLARRASVAQSSINRILTRPGYTPSLATVTKLADSLGVSAGWLASGQGPAHLPPPGVPSAYLLRESSNPGLPADSRLSEAMSILERMDDSERGKVLAVLRLIDHPRRNTK